MAMVAAYQVSSRMAARFIISSCSFSSFSSFRDLKSAIKSEKDPVKVAQLFQSSISIPTFRRHRPLFTLSVQKLSRSKRFDLIDRVLTTCITSPPAPASQLSSEGFWIRIAMLYSQAGMVDNALQVFDKMLQQGNCTVTQKTLCGVLSVMLDNKIYTNNDKFPHTFQAFMMNWSLPRGVKSFNLILKAHCKGGCVDKAQAMIANMGPEAYVQPNIDSYNILLGSINKKSEFDMVVKEINEEGLEHNLTTYNHRITRYCKSKEPVRAYKLLEEMISKGRVEPNCFTYRAIILGFCKVGDFESARKIIDKMVSDGYVKKAPPSFGYYVLMKHMLEEGDFDGGLEICKDILRNKWVPPFKATALLMDGLVKASKADQAKEILDKLKRQLRGSSALDSWGKIEAGLPPI